MTLTPELLLHGYSIGVFPMAEHRNDPEVFWVDPQRRGVLPLDRFRIARSLARRMRRGDYRISIDEDFARVVQGCADRADTWISEEISQHYSILHDTGHAHSLEVWDGEALIGGVYGVVLGAAYFGESMFSRRDDASKIALAYLVDRLNQAGFTLFDTQFLTDHLASLGGVEISRAQYHQHPQPLTSGGDTAQHPDIVARMIKRAQRRGGCNHPAFEPDFGPVLFAQGQKGKRIAGRVVGRIAAIAQGHIQPQNPRASTGGQLYVNRAAIDLVQPAQHRAKARCRLFLSRSRQAQTGNHTGKDQPLHSSPPLPDTNFSNRFIRLTAPWVSSISSPGA